MLHKTTLGVLLALAGGAGAALTERSTDTPIRPADLAGPQRASEPDELQRVSTVLRRRPENVPAAPGGAGRTSAEPSRPALTAGVAADDALMPFVTDVLRVAGNGSFQVHDLTRADVVLRVLNGSSDAAIATREPSRGERRRGIAEQRLGDLIAVLVTHPDNRIGQVSSAAMRRILRGAASDWSEVGGQRAPIHLIVPPAGPEADLFARILVRGDSLKLSSTEAASDDARLRLVAADPNAVTIASLESARRAQLPVLRIDGAAPSLGAHRSGWYPYGAPIVLVHLGSPAGQSVAAAMRRAPAQNELARYLSIDGRR